MAEAVKIQAETRDPKKNKGTGTRIARRLRSNGRIPAILYGHKQAPVPISLSQESVWEMIKKSTHLAELNLGESTEMALVRHVQWDHLGKEIIHLDFARVSADESIEIEVRLDIRGTAPGVAEGGVLEQQVHTLRVTCRANAIPDTIRVDLSNLHLGDALHVRDLTGLPEGVTINTDPEQLLVHVTTRAAAPEPTAAEAEAESAVQPEVIKPERKEKEE